MNIATISFFDLSELIANMDSHPFGTFAFVLCAAMAWHAYTSKK
jgi:hypothetical protein